MSNPDAASKTSDSAAWSTTRVLREKEPVRAVERLAPRNASMQSTRVAIHAGIMADADPTITEIPRANSSTAGDGDGLMGIAAMPPSDGNANRKIRRVPANAIPSLPLRRTVTAGYSR